MEMEKLAIAAVFLLLMVFVVGVACHDGSGDVDYDGERFTFDTVAA